MEKTLEFRAIENGAAAIAGLVRLVTDPNAMQAAIEVFNNERHRAAEVIKQAEIAVRRLNERKAVLDVLEARAVEIEARSKEVEARSAQVAEYEHVIAAKAAELDRRRAEWNALTARVRAEYGGAAA